MKVDNGLNNLWEGLDRALNSSSSRMEASAKQATSQTTSKGSSTTKVEDAMDLVNAAKDNTNRETMRTWDKHTDMVEKSRELRETRERQQAIERRNQERREDQTELMAQIAIENANRAQMFEAEAIERQNRKMAAVA